MDILQKLDKLNLNAANSVIIGSGILNALGVRKSGDIDVIVDQDTYAGLQASDRFSKEENHGREVLTDGLFEINTSLIFSTIRD